MDFTFSFYVPAVLKVFKSNHFFAWFAFLSALLFIIGSCRMTAFCCVGHEHRFAVSAYYHDRVGQSTVNGSCVLLCRIVTVTLVHVARYVVILRLVEASVVSHKVRVAHKLLQEVAADG